MNIEYVCPWEVEVKWHKPDGVTRVIHASGKTREDAFDQVRLIMDTPSISFDEAARRARWKPNSDLSINTHKPNRALCVKGKERQ